MAKRVIVIVLLVILGIFVYVGYHSYDGKRTGANGEVYSNGAVRRIEATPPPPAEDADTIVYPTAATPGATAQSAATTGQAATPLSGNLAMPSASQQPGSAQVTQGQQPAAANAPATDTISANPPNGMAFTGTGKYQLYRQGNITWRLDTDTGRTCVIFATDEEWRKPKVYRAGCGKS
jgi:hypothetical protein